MIVHNFKNTWCKYEIAFINQWKRFSHIREFSDYFKLKNNFKKNMSQIENHTSTWIETPLSKFGFKCIMNKHDFCDDSLCECLCHHV